MDASEAQRLRDANRAAFLKLLGHLGRMEYDEFEACLSEDFVQVWPYLPLASLPNELKGRRALREAVERGMSGFDPYDYTIDAIHDMLDPEMLVAEYTSHSFYHPKQLPYSNRYLSILRFREGKLVHWVEYVNPLIIKEAMLEDADRTISERYEAAKSSSRS
jgi:ketosteroid isomerase-like protein